MIIDDIDDIIDYWLEQLMLSSYYLEYLIIIHDFWNLQKKAQNIS